MRAPALVFSLALAGLVAGLAAPASAQDSYEARHLSLVRFVGVVEIETGAVDRITVEYDTGEDLIDLAQFEVRGDELVITQLPRRTRTSCRSRGQQRSVEIDRDGYHPIEDYGRLTVRAPADARIEIGGGALLATIGDVGELSLGVNSCADITAGDVAGDASVAINGSGDIEIGAIGGGLEVAMNGSGDISTGAVAGGLEVAINGSGDVVVASVSGRIEAAIHGSGDVTVHGGQVLSIEAAIMGSGDVRFDGVAGQVQLAAFGSGDVYVSEVSGRVDTSAFGSGRVHVGER